jgi:hypothetical protein
VLHAGDQTTTSATIASVPVSDEIGWSRDAARYKAMLAQVAAIRKEIDHNVAGPGVRYSTRLLDMTPDDTVFYVAIPNLSETIADKDHRATTGRGRAEAVVGYEQASSRGSKVNAAISDQRVRRTTWRRSLPSQMSATSREPDGPLVFDGEGAAGFRAYADSQLALCAQPGSAQTFLHRRPDQRRRGG